MSENEEREKMLAEAREELFKAVPREYVEDFISRAKKHAEKLYAGGDTMPFALSVLCLEPDMKVRVYRFNLYFRDSDDKYDQLAEIAGGFADKRLAVVCVLVASEVWYAKVKSRDEIKGAVSDYEGKKSALMVVASSPSLGISVSEINPVEEDGGETELTGWDRSETGESPLTDHFFRSYAEKAIRGLMQRASKNSDE